MLCYWATFVPLSPRFAQIFRRLEYPRYLATIRILYHRSALLGLSDAEKPLDSSFADEITVSSIAVCKDYESDRLISWPRLQNSYFEQPPDVDLPHPGVLSRVHLHSKSVRATQGFEMDVTNMFHQLVLPRWLSMLLPFTKVVFGNLTGAAQLALMRKLEFDKRPRQNSLFRPHLRTMPMGFSWAVHVAHEVAAF